MIYQVQRNIFPLQKKKQVRNKTCWSWLSGIGRLCIGHCSFYIGLCLMSGQLERNEWLLLSAFQQGLQQKLVFVLTQENAFS